MTNENESAGMYKELDIELYINKERSRWLGICPTVGYRNEEGQGQAMDGRPGGRRIRAEDF